MTLFSSLQRSAFVKAFRYPPFLAVLGCGVIVRVWVMSAYYPAVMLMFDSPRYARVGMRMFGDFWMPAGYPLLLQLLRTISRQLWVTIMIQHFMGISIGMLLFAAMQRLRLPKPVACVVAAIPLLSGDQLYLEHTIMADHVLLVFAVAGLSAGIYGLVPTTKAPWICLSSIFLALAGLTRSVGIFLLPVLALCVLLSAGATWRSRGKAMAAAILPATAVLAVYVGAFYLVRGKYLGFTDMAGWNLYSRVAPFADCTKFNPPAGTAILCDQRAVAQRPGPFGYVWDVTSTPRKAFTLGPETGGPLGAFAKRAIMSQPRDYLSCVGIDFVRYLDPGIYAHRPYSGQSPELLSFGWRNLAAEKIVVEAMSKRYQGTRPRIYGEEILAFYQRLFRPGGLLICGFVVFSVVGAMTSRGAVCLGISLFGLSAFVLDLVPVLTISYDYRYGLPSQVLIAVSGVLGMFAVWQRVNSLGKTRPEKVGDP